jgi:hypothetical protein
MSEEGAHGQSVKAGERRRQRRTKTRNALYYWRLLRQLPWLVLRYKL